MAARISGFTITRAANDYALSFETEEGSPVELTASYEQLDLIAEALDAQLDSDEEDALGIENEED